MKINNVLKINNGVNSNITEKLTKHEKALELAQKTRDDLGTKSLHNVLLNCKTICRYLDTSRENEWVDLELNGYHGTYKTLGEGLDKVPQYRHAVMIFYNERNQEIVFDHEMQEIMGKYILNIPISELESFRGKYIIVKDTAAFDVFNDYLRKKQTTSKIIPRIINAKISPNYVERVINGVTNKVNEFLDELILKLEYDSTQENTHTQIRKTESKLSKVISEINIKNGKNNKSEVSRLTMKFIRMMWESGKFTKPRSLWTIQNFAESEGYIFTKRAITIALKKSDFITCVGKHSNGVPIYSQTYPSKHTSGNAQFHKHIQIFESLDLHPDIRHVSSSLFRDGHYTQAITEALKKVNNMVKSKSGRQDLDGKTLMQTVFSPNSPILKLNQLQTTTERDEQEGFMHLFAGSMQGIRNPKVHDEIIQDDPFKTIEYLCLASMLAKTIDISTQQDCK